MSIRPQVRARRGVLVALLAASALLVASPPAPAIINGAPDGNGHPYVGAVGPPRPIHASGTLISPTVVLTAAHVAERRLGPSAARVTFHPDAKSPSATWYTGTAYLHPSWLEDDPRPGDDVSDSASVHDLAVIVLDEPVTGITPASLPTENLLGEQEPGALSRSAFTSVGYGISKRLNEDGGGKPGGAPGGDRASAGTRRVADAVFASLGSNFVRARMEGDTEVCSGDSGGPILFGGTNTVAGVSVIEWSLSGGECRSLGWWQRVDTPAAREFLGQFVTLP